MPGTLRSCWLACTCKAQGWQTCLTQTDGEMDGDRRWARLADMPMVSRDREPGAGAQLSLGEGELHSIHASSPRAPSWVGGEQKATRAVFLGPMEERGEGWGWGTLACALSPAAAGAELLAGTQGSGSARGCRSTGALQAPTDPCPPHHVLPQQGPGCSGFAVSWTVPENSGKLTEGGSILGAGGPAALHQLGKAGRASLRVRELCLS